MPFFNFDNINCFYEVYGEGEPLLLLHGNSVSSKMFKSEIEFYQDKYQVIVFDYPGLGQSDRIPYFRDDYWNYNSYFAFCLLDLLNIAQTKVIGTSGGALVGLNMVATGTDRVSALIADSFMGFGLNLEESKLIATRRKAAKSKMMEVAFWKYMNGEDWINVVDQDIDLMKRCGSKGLLTIQGDLSKVQCPVMCIASSQDEFIPDLHDKVKKVSDQIPNSKLVLLDYGKHPFMITEKESFRAFALEFFGDKVYK